MELDVVERTGSDAKGSEIAAYRAAHVPLYNQQPLKLGLFSVNCNNSVLCSDTPTSFEVTWEHSLAIAQLADEIGFEVIVPVARWLGFGGRMNFHGNAFETLTYAAGLAARTRNIMIFATIHAPVVNPIMAAKAIATIDHISGGRAGLNIVMGWYAEEMKMLGIEMREHGNRYHYGAEWIEVIERLWSSDAPFNFSGEYFDLVGCESNPKPVQPRPVLVNAGGSPAGIDFSARHADFNFTNFTTEEQAARYTKRFREKAWDDYGRTAGMLTMVVVVCRDTEAEAKAAYQSILDNGDWVAADNYIAGLSINPGAHEEHLRREFVQKFVAGAGSQALVGTPEQVADGFAAIKAAGIDGVFLGMIDYINELKYFSEKVMPILKQRGLRV